MIYYMNSKVKAEAGDPRLDPGLRSVVDALVAAPVELIITSVWRPGDSKSSHSRWKGIDFQPSVAPRDFDDNLATAQQVMAVAASVGVPLLVELHENRTPASSASTYGTARDREMFSKLAWHIHVNTNTKGEGVAWAPHPTVRARLAGEGFSPAYELGGAAVGPVQPAPMLAAPPPRLRPFSVADHIGSLNEPLGAGRDAPHLTAWLNYVRPSIDAFLAKHAPGASFSGADVVEGYLRAAFMLAELNGLTADRTSSVLPSLPLLLAQAQMETAFGTRVRAGNPKTNVFNVGVADAGDYRFVAKLGSAPTAQAAYIALVAANYISPAGGEVNLLAPGRYVNYAGNRYASAPDYETMISAQRGVIVKRLAALGVATFAPSEHASHVGSVLNAAQASGPPGSQLAVSNGEMIAISRLLHVLGEASVVYLPELESVLRNAPPSASGQLSAGLRALRSAYGAQHSAASVALRLTDAQYLLPSLATLRAGYFSWRRLPERGDLGNDALNVLRDWAFAAGIHDLGVASWGGRRTTTPLFGFGQSRVHLPPTANLIEVTDVLVSS